mgnify:CR=1 FL=1|tara:strand:+ start:2444 stop:2623 length:180 start_codon:yes stop_codon:yes gene_type:complete
MPKDNNNRTKSISVAQFRKEIKNQLTMIRNCKNVAQATIAIRKVDKKLEELAKYQIEKE